LGKLRRVGGEQQLLLVLVPDRTATTPGFGTPATCWRRLTGR
jgi:hypothetical protein